jgi:hypothetical protein
MGIFASGDCLLNRENGFFEERPYFVNIRLSGTAKATEKLWRWFFPDFYKRNSVSGSIIQYNI